MRLPDGDRLQLQPVLRLIGVVGVGSAGGAFGMAVQGQNAGWLAAALAINAALVALYQQTLP